MLESGDLSVECGDDFLRVHVGKYSRPAESTGLLSLLPVAGHFRWSSGSLLFEALRDNVQESRKRPTTWLSRRDHPR
jgi:hypothetical protein